MSYLRPCQHIAHKKATAMVVAWEQVVLWQSYLTLPEACAAVGLGRRAINNWEAMAKHLAMLWLKMRNENRAFHRDVHRITTTERHAA